MRSFKSEKIKVTVDFDMGIVKSLQISDKERAVSSFPVFRVGLRNRSGEISIITPEMASAVKETDTGAEYYSFKGYEGLSIRITTKESRENISWRMNADIPQDLALEWFELPSPELPDLKKNKAGGGEVLIPYNEGLIVDDMDKREGSWFPHMETQYPSIGAYYMFPNMIQSQFIAYLFSDLNFYIGAHDKKRAPKQISFMRGEGGIILSVRHFAGGDFGESFSMDYPFVWCVTDSGWESAADKYREWFQNNLPPRVKKIAENERLPEWYYDSPLIVTYPVRGEFDTDAMEPNSLYPYTNALPVIREIKEKTGSKIMALLMHWEGTAPWAPPYVWPPYGGEENFLEFRDALHKVGDLLGVYCSGFGYTLKSNLVDGYERREEYEKRGLSSAMCQGPRGEIIGKICTAQREGLDICPASKMGRELLKEAYYPLFDSGIDYAQILDQNHGGGQYLCYSREHGHKPTPGVWMTENMQDMLTEWNEKASKMLFGCESAAAEPFIANLLLSDNRYELNYRMGRPVPLYSYIYHEYIRNFMGNQVCSPFDMDEETLIPRLAYSYSIGDSMTLVLHPSGELLTSWGARGFKNYQDKEATLLFIKNLNANFKAGAFKYLVSGRMTKLPDVKIGKVKYRAGDSEIELPEIFIAAYEAECGKTAIIAVNPQRKEASFTLSDREYKIGALDAITLIV